MTTTQRFLLATILLATSVASAGCYSGIKAVEVPADKSDDIDGIRYYLAAPYLVLEHLGEDRWDARLEIGVDRSREFAVQPFTHFGATTTTMDFNPDGTIKSFVLNADTTKVSEALITVTKEMELERLRLKKEAIEAERKAAEEKAKEEKAKGTNSAFETFNNTIKNNPQSRTRFEIYRIHGDKLLKE